MLYNRPKYLIARFVLILILLGIVLSSALTQSIFTVRAGNVVALLGETVRISVDATSAQGDNASYVPSISGDGRYVAFISAAANLVNNDTNGAEDIFVYDLQIGMPNRISVDSNSVQANGGSGYQSISRDGRYVAFASTATNLVSGDTNGMSDIFVRDVQLGVTSRVSVDSSGAQANNNSSSYTSISADGRYVAFISSATNLVSNDTNGLDDIFVRDTQTGVVTRIPVGSNSALPSYVPDYQSISANGRYVAFNSNAGNLVLGDTNGNTDVFLYDLQTGVTSRVSVDSSGQESNGQSTTPFVSAGGRYVAFTSSATNLVAGDTNGVNDIFVRDMQTGITTRVSLDSNGAQASGGSSYQPLISIDGRYIAFYSSAANLVAGDTNGMADVFLRDMQTGETTRVSITSIGLQANGNSQYISMSSDGSLMAFTSYATNLVAGDTNSVPDIFVHRQNPSWLILAGDTVRVSIDSNGGQGIGGASQQATISADGHYIAFMSFKPNLVGGDTNGEDDIFLRDLQTGTTIRVSVDSNGVQANNGSDAPSISADGRYIAFASPATNLVANDTNSKKDIFARDAQMGITTLVSVDSSGVQANGFSYEPSISADGRYVVFESDATNLVPGDTNGTRDIFVHDLQTNITSRVSIDSNGGQANNISSSASISSNGRYITFSSAATNLVLADTNLVDDVFMRDLQTGQTARVSVDSSGTQAVNGNSIHPSISADGNYVAFESYATNLVTGDTNAAGDIYLHNRQTGITTRVSVASGNLQSNNASVYPSISGDGRHISFYSGATDLVPSDTNAVIDVFVHDVQTGKTTRASVNSNGIQGNERSDSPSITADGQYISFQSFATNLTIGDTNGAPDVFVHRQDFSPAPTSTPTNILPTATIVTPTLTAIPTFTPIVTPTPTLTPTYTPTSTPLLFQPYVNFPIGDGRAVAIGDFNSDGLQDVAVTNSMASTSLLYIFLQKSDGSLATPVTYDAGYQPFSLAVGDLNHDGRTDIVTTNMPSNEISVFLQKTDGSMAPRITYSTITGRVAVAVGDLNGDGLDDIAVSGNDLGVFIQNMAGTLNPMVTYTTPGSPIAIDDIVIADVNNDGKSDVIKKQGYPDFVVYLQNANGTLSPGVSYPSDTCQPLCGINGLDTGDVNGDGVTDIVMSYGGNRPDSKIAVFTQANDSSLNLPVIYDAYDIPGPVEIADVNQDNLADILVTHSAWTKMSLYLQQSNGLPNPYNLYTIPYGDIITSGMAVGDINHDGLPDVAIAGYNFGLVILYHAPSLSTPTPTHIPINTSTSTPSNTPTLTSTTTFTATATPIATYTATSSPTATVTYTATTTPTATFTSTSTFTATTTPTIPAANVPIISSVIRTNISPTSASNVNFHVVFSENVTGVDSNDFDLTTTGVTGASITSVSGSGTIYTVTVNTGSGNGTIRLDVVDDDSIRDGVNNPLGGVGLGNGNFTSGEAYIIKKTWVFGDAPISYWANNYIESLYKGGITGGCSVSPLNYCPEAVVTRAQMAVFLLRGIHGASYAPPAVGSSTGFNDVPVGYWAGAWIKQLAAEGITGGCGNGSYCPEVVVTRAQMAVFLLRAKHGAGYLPPSVVMDVFGDVPVGYWAATWIKQLAAEAITGGCGNGNYCPDSSVTRAQMAVFLVRTFNLP